ncbi:MAG: TldD/PmbA family protein [Candidatus Eisenbacteria bacterium]
MEEKVVLERVLEVLKAAGAEGDAFFEHRRSLRLHVREGRLEEIQRAEVQGVGIRAIREGRLGFVHTSAADPEKVVEAAKQAVDVLRFATPREDLALAPPAGPGDGSDEGAALAIYDASLEKRPLREKQDWITSAEAIGRGADPKIKKTEGASYDENLTGTWLANTRGLFRHYRKSGVSASLQVIAEDAGEMQPGETEIQVGSWDALGDPGALARRASERALRLLGGRPVPTGRYPVLFSPEAGFAPLVYLTVALRGDHIARGRSWLADRADPLLASPLVTVHDAMRMPGGPATVPFDGEGIDTRDLTLLEQGKIAGRMCDLAAAKRLGAQSTGSSRRGGYESLPEIGGGNISIAPGTQKLEEIVAGIDRGLWVWGLSGWWIGLDPSNSDFSSAAFGLWIEKGKPVRPVARVTVAGSIPEIFRGIEAIADDLVWDGPLKTPSFRVKELAVSGS